MLSSASLTRVFHGVFLCLAVVIPLLAGCDRQSGTTAQPQLSDSPVAGAVAGAGATGAGDAQTPTGIDRSHKGEPLPDLTFKDPAGHTLRLPAQTGRPLLVNLWATWCAPCVAELPTLDALAARQQPRVITLSQDMGDGAAVASFLKGKGLTHLTPWLDPEATAAARYGGGSLPMTIYYDTSGHELWRWNGGNEWTSPAAARLLAETPQG